MTPKNTNFRVLTDFSAPYTFAPSSFHINFNFMHKLAWDDGGHSPEKPWNVSVISAQSSDLQRPL